ncbi:MAG: T9SS type A sorting domain-containing protein [Chitinophagales bacterium]|nr:T9SS type A sorting domain-containing protein [Chitinophagales bacterium]MDW8418373.1 T9SS type A sorting domain-containing protein [Chitinophagales bacterium]
MRKSIWVLCCAALVVTVSAQEEVVTPLTVNIPQYRVNRSPSKYKYLIEKGQIVVQSDTLSLPFIDDFSRPGTLRSYKWIENHITDTFFNVIGPCLIPEGVVTQQITVISDTAYTYSYNSVTNTVDSAALPPIQFTFFGPSTQNCLSATPQTLYFWKPYKRYIFDSSGHIIDSIPVNSTAQTLDYAPVIYVAQGEPGTLWFDNYAWRNNTFPLNPPTIGVATLDGLNEYGLPYNNTSVNTYGNADQLTSKPINLQGLTEADSVYLSFLYQPKGLGEAPDPQDSLIVSFKDIGGIWYDMWARPGYAVFHPDSNRFQQVFIKIPDRPIFSTFFHPTFQFRIRNKASLYGMLDHWHIDYVKLDKNRSATDTIINDVSFVYDFPCVLKNYTLMPADHFQPATDLADSIWIQVNNLSPAAFTNPPATNFTYGAAINYPAQAIVLNNLTQTFNATPEYNINIRPAEEYQVSSFPSLTDSLVLISEVYVVPNDSRKINDTLRQRLILSNILAYDDGSAEAAYGLTGLGIKKFAYKFTIPQPDTLVGFQVMFAQVEQKVNDLVFNYQLWDSITPGNPAVNDEPVFAVENKKPYYVDSVNGFYTYVLDSPIIVPRQFYFGWAQEDTRSLQIGYDLNSKLGHPNMYAYKNSTWLPTQITLKGSPMIRLIFDSEYPGFGTRAGTLPGALPVTLHPVPATDFITIHSPAASLRYEVYDVSGYLLLNGSGKVILLHTLPDGMYITRIWDVISGQSAAVKFIKTTH